MTFNPKNGKIGPMCAYLGYTDNQGTRSERTLSVATKRHRFDFIAKTQGLNHQFPIDENAYEARECARTFLEANPGLFKYSEEAVSSGFPIYPQDQNKIVGALTRLMCQQEYIFRRNNRVKTSRHLHQEQLKEFQSTNDSEYTLKANSDESTLCIRNPRLVEKNLDTYQPPRSCLKNPAVRIVEESKYTFPAQRYYSDMPVEDTEKSRLGDYFTESPASRASTPPEKRQRIDDYEFSSPVIITGALQRKFDVHEYQQTPRLASPAPITRIPISTRLQAQMFASEDTVIVDSAMEEEQLKSSVRRSLVVKLRVPSLTMTKGTDMICHDEQQSLATGDDCVVSIDKTREISNSGCWTPIEPGGASMPLTRTSQEPRRNSLETRFRTPVYNDLELPPVGENIDCTGTVPTDPDRVLATKRESSLTITTAASQLQEIETTIQAFDSQDTCNEDSIFCANTELINKVPEKPMLQFMFQNPNGRPDRKNIMSGKTLLGMNLSELFATVSNRTEKAHESVTFRYREWGEGAAIVVQKTDSEDEWQDIKDEFVMVFKDAMLEYPSRKEFLVWVKGGDRTKMEKTNSGGDD